MRIALINPRSRRPNQIQQKCFAPLGLLYLASSLLVKGHDVSVVDSGALGLSDEDICNRVKIYAPDIIGIPLLSDIFFETYELSRRVKEACPGAKLVLGGVHASALPVTVLEEFPWADYVLQGEAEESMAQLLEAIHGNAPISSVPGLYYRVGEGVSANARNAAIEKLDRLRGPARELVDEMYRSKRYYMVLRRERPIDIMVTSRGCPYRCGFCCNTAGAYRARSAENVMEEILSIVSRGIKSIDIADSNFTFDRARAMRIFDLIIREKLGLSLRIKSRADSIDKELVKRAREAGVYLISLGMESGSQRMLDRMSKGTKLSENIEASRIVMNAGIKLNTGWVVGYPGEAIESVEETIKFIRALKPTTANINALVPYPGTVVYEEAKRDGTLAGDWTVETKGLPWIKLPWINSRSELEKVAQHVKNKVYYRPYYIANFAGEVIGNANLTLARYALQESLKSIGGIS